MDGPFSRRPFALANWKMAMTVSESLLFLDEFRRVAGDLLQTVDVVLCPPYTGLHGLAQALADTPIALGAQDLCASPGKAHTGQVSAPLLVDVGCEWVMLNHWEIRRRTGETDEDINLKMHAAFDAGLRPILLVGESTTEQGQAESALAARLPTLFTDCAPEHVADMVMVYEPEWTIGVRDPASPAYVATGCRFIRQWVGREYGPRVAERMRIIYGGSVAPEYAEGLLSPQDVDGAGASRKGRDPVAFAEIVRLIAVASQST
jgi:triosephosphate isomerase